MRKFIALVLFTGTFILCGVASAYADQLPADVRVELAVKTPAVEAEYFTFMRPATPAVKMEERFTVMKGSVTAPEAHCNSPGFWGTDFTTVEPDHLLIYGLRY